MEEATKIKCPTCGKRLVVMEERRHHRIVCPYCAHVVPTAKPEDEGPTNWDEMPDNLLQWYRGLLKTPDGLATAGLVLSFLSVPFVCLTLYGAIFAILLSLTGLGLAVTGLVREQSAPLDEEEPAPGAKPRRLELGKWKVSLTTLGIIGSLATLFLALVPVIQHFHEPH